jgi:4'-phosphopantetheinyl transferase
MRVPGGHEVHVWYAVLDGPAETRDATSLLSDDERERAARFHFERDRRRFVAGRTTLRRLLAAYTGTAAADLVFRASEGGKPELACHPTLQFNVSHSHELLACAVSAFRVGIDVEHLRPLPNALDLASRFFSMAEVEALRREDGRTLERRFFTCWTRKEAYVKATGQGLAAPLDRFTVSLDPARPALLHADGDPAAPHRWTLADLDAGEAYVGAVAVELGCPVVLQRSWPPA